MLQLRGLRPQKLCLYRLTKSLECFQQQEPPAFLLWVFITFYASPDSTVFSKLPLPSVAPKLLPQAVQVPVVAMTTVTAATVLESEITTFSLLLMLLLQLPLPLLML